MNTALYYASHSGNTRRIAEAIATPLRSRGRVEIHAIDGMQPPVAPDVDLLIVGSPTEGRHALREVGRFVDALATNGVRGRPAAAFDTRLDWPRWLSGSAAADIGRGLEAAGATLVAPPESFLVSTAPELLAGELDRAKAWAGDVAAAIDESGLVETASGSVSRMRR